MATAAVAAPSHGLQTWALQVRTRIARQTDMATLHDMIREQGTQWLDAYLEDLIKAGPHKGAIAELMKTPGKNRNGPKTRAAAANADKAKAKIASANKENASGAPAKKTTRFQRALLQVKENQIDDVDMIESAALEKALSPKKVADPEPEPLVDVQSPVLDKLLDDVDNTMSAVVPKKGKPAKSKGGKKGGKGKGKGKSKKAVETADEEDVADVVEPASVVEDAAETPVVPNKVSAFAAGPATPIVPREVHAVDYADILDETVHMSVTPISPTRPPATSQQSAFSPTRPSTPLEESHATEEISFIAPTPAASSFEQSVSEHQQHSIPAVSPAVEGINLLVSSSEHLGTDLDTLLEDEEVEASLSSELLVPSITDTASLSIIEEGDEPSSLSPPASQSDPQPVQQDVIAPAPVASPVKRVSPVKPAVEPATSADDFPPSAAQSALAQQLSRPLRPLPSGPPRVSTNALSGPPPVARGSGGLRSSWLTKALREDGAASTSLPPSTVPNVPSKQPIVSSSLLQQRGEKRKSSALEISSAPAAPEPENQPASKTRKVGPTGERELSKSAGVALRAEPADDEQQGMLERVKGKVEGLLVRADKDEEKNKHVPKEAVEVNEEHKRTDSAGSKRLTARLSVSDLVSVFENRSVPVEEPESVDAPNTAAVAPPSEPAFTILRDSTTPLNSPPVARPSLATNAGHANLPTVSIVPPSAVAGLAAPTVIEGLPSPSPSFGLIPSQSTQSTATTESDFWANIPGAFTQTTAVSSQHTTWVDTTVTISTQGSAAECLSAAVKEDKEVPQSQDDVQETDEFTSDEADTLGQSELKDSVTTQPNPLASSAATLNVSTTSHIPQSSSQGLLAQAGAVVSKVLGVGSSSTSKKGKETIKSIHLAAASAKKEQMEKDRKAARARDIEERRQAAAQRKRDEEKAKEEEQKKAKAAEVEKRKREREEATNKSRFVRKGEEEPNKKRKLTVDGDRKPELKKAPSKDTLRKNMKTPTPGPSSIMSKSGTKPLGSSQPAMGKSTSSIYPALPTTTPGKQPSVKLVSSTVTTSVMESNVATTSTSAGPARPSAIPTKSVVRPSNLKQPIDDGRTPMQTLQAQMHARVQAQLQTTQVQQEVIASENIELPEIASEYSDSDDEERVRNYPDWTQSPELRAQLQAQQTVNPDAIFGAIRPLHMEEIFRTRQSRFRARTSSANWAGQDRLTPMEEMEYARRMGFS